METTVGGNETILVAEDEEQVRKFIVRVLQRQGYIVLEVFNVDEGITICEQREDPIHLILKDVVMPKTSGHDLVERCKQVRQDFKGLYMSGYPENEIAHHGDLGEETNYIQKPFTMDELVRKVREVLGKD